MSVFVIFSEIVSASFSAFFGKERGKSYSAKIDCISTSLSPGIPRILTISPKGFFDFSGQSVIFAIAFSPFFTPFKLFLEIKISMGTELLSGTRNAKFLETSTIPTNCSFARLMISVICPSGLRPFR